MVNAKQGNNLFEQRGDVLKGQYVAGSANTWLLGSHGTESGTSVCLQEIMYFLYNDSTLWNWQLVKGNNTIHVNGWNNPNSFPHQILARRLIFKWGVQQWNNEVIMPDRFCTTDRSAATQCSAKSCALQPSIRRMDCVAHQPANNGAAARSVWMSLSKKTCNLLS